MLTVAVWLADEKCVPEAGEKVSVMFNARRATCAAAYETPCEIPCARAATVTPSAAGSVKPSTASRVGRRPTNATAERTTRMARESDGSGSMRTVLSSGGCRRAASLAGSPSYQARGVPARPAERRDGTQRVTRLGATHVSHDSQGASANACETVRKQGSVRNTTTSTGGRRGVDDDPVLLDAPIDSRQVHAQLLCRQFLVPAIPRECVP